MSGHGPAMALPWPHGPAVALAWQSHGDADVPCQGTHEMELKADRPSFRDGTRYTENNTSHWLEVLHSTLNTNTEFKDAA